MQENCFFQTLHDKIPLTVSLQTGAAIKFRQCSSLLLHIITAKSHFSQVTNIMTSCGTNLNKHFITNCTAKTFARMTARVSYQVKRIYKLHVSYQV